MKASRQVIRATARSLGKLFRSNPEPQKRSIEAGGAGWRWSGSPALRTPQTSLLAARGRAQDRAAALTLNNPLAARTVETWTAALIGKGWHAQSRHPDRDTARTLSEEFEALICCNLPIIARAVVRDGESFIRLLPQRDVFRIAILHAEQIDPSHSIEMRSGGRILSGIEYDADDLVTAYHIFPDPPSAPFARIGNRIRLPADEVLHIFDQLQPGQTRGLSWLAPVLLKLADYDAASDAMLMNLKVQSLFAGFITDPEGGAGGFDEGTGGATADLSLEPGAMRLLPPGADVRFSQPGAGLSQQSDFMKGQLREIATGTGLMYEQLTGDLSGANYSSARFGLLEFRRRAEMLQRSLIDIQLLRPLWRRWIDWKILRGDISPDEAADFLAVRFVPPGWQWVDPQKEVNAEVKAIEAGLKSRAEVVAGRGRDVTEVDEEITADPRAAKNGGQEQ